MRYLVIAFSVLFLVSARLEVLSPLEPASDAPEGWLQVCCQDNDKNDDGAISFREFTPFVLEILDVDRKALGEIFLAGDLDRNSDLDGNECPIIRAQIRDRMRKKVQEALATFDADKDGRLSKEEVQRLALKNFKLMAPEADQIFSEFHGPVSGENLTKLLLELRARQIEKFGNKLAKWDDDSNGKISYEEMRRGINGTAARKTLKETFKRIDFDKDLHLSAVEYIKLLDELEQSRADAIPPRPKRSDDITSFDYDEKMLRNIHSSKKILFQDWDYPGDGKHRIVPREVTETAPPPVDVDKVKISESGEIDMEFAALLSSKSMMGGGRPPAELEVATVKYDDPGFQRWRSI